MITINIEKAKNIAHAIRREERAKEFAPFDDAIAKQIPGQSAGAEEQRQIIREKYAQIQIAIDEATTIDDIQSALPKK